MRFELRRCRADLFCRSAPWSFGIFGAPNQPGKVRTRSPAGGKAAPLVIPSQLFLPDPETAIDAVAPLSVVRRQISQVVARRYGKFPDVDSGQELLPRAS